MGDNIASLEAALRLRGKGDIGKVTTELALGRPRLRWRVRVGHFPAEVNTVADALSRLSAPDPSRFPAELIKSSCVDVPAPDEAFSLIS